MSFPWHSFNQALTENQPFEFHTEENLKKKVVKVTLTSQKNQDWASYLILSHSALALVFPR